MTKYNLVSGWKRSGTSALMLALRQCGIPVIGHKYPFGYKTLEGKEDLTVGSYFPIENKTLNDNPTGYWEVPDLANYNGVNKKWDKVGLDGDLIKVPFDVLNKSDVEMIDKVIIIIRDPRKVFTSQMKAGMLKKERIPVSALQTLFIAVSSIYWLTEKKIPFYIMLYEELLKNPLYQLKGCCKFLGRGDPKWGARAITKKLDRSKKLYNRSPEMKKLMNFYTNLKKNHKCEIYDLNEMIEDIKKINKEGYITFKEK